MQDAPCCAVDCIGTGFRVRMQEEEEGMKCSWNINTRNRGSFRQGVRKRLRFMARKILPMQTVIQFLLLEDLSPPSGRQFLSFVRK